MEKLKQIKRWVIEQVLWAESAMKGKTGAEKKAAVVKKLDDLIQLPFYLEWCDDIVIEWLVDQACDKLNGLIGHNFADTKLSNEQENSIANSIEVKF